VPQDAPNRVEVHNTNGVLVGSPNAAGAGGNVDGLLPFTDRVLAKDNANNFVNQVTSAALTAAPTGVAFDVLDRCTNQANTRDIEGRGTSFIRCVFDDATAGGERLSVIAHNGANSYAGSSKR
jgi:hypothetical protein